MGLGIDFGDLGVDFVTDFEDVGGFADLFAGDLGDVDEAVCAGDDFGESAEIGEGDDLDVSDVAFLVLVGEDLPRILFRILAGEGDALCVFVDILYDYVDHVSDLEDVGRVSESLPADIFIKTIYRLR